MKSHSKAPGSLVALASAAIMAVYGAGYARTRSAAARFDEEPALRRPADAQPAAPAVVHTPVTADALPPAGRPAAPRTHTDARPLRPTTPNRVAALPGGSPSTAVPARPGLTTAESSAAPEPAQPVPPASAAPATDTRATDSAEPATSTPTPTLYPKIYYQDGTYSGWGSSRHGDIQATVVISNGRITSATITQCLTRYSCSLIAHLQGQVVARQSADVDFVSGATQSVDAFYYAVVEALSKAK